MENVLGYCAIWTLVYIYIYMYKTETYETPTIFHVTTIFFFKILFILFI